MHKFKSDPDFISIEEANNQLHHSSKITNDSNENSTAIVNAQGLLNS